MQRARSFGIGAFGLPAAIALAVFAGGCPAKADEPRAVEEAGPTVSVRLLSKLHPRSLGVSGPRRLAATAVGDELRIDGRPSPSLELPTGEWRLGTPVGTRRYRGRLSLSARAGELVVVLRTPLEDYVAATVASETTPGAPPAALRAQAIVARSWTLAAGPRHEDADRCDLSHCQVLAGRGDPRHLAAAREAAAATAGRVLLLADGGVALAPFHAACGGHTADPVELFGGPDRSGAAAVADPGCPAAPWEARVPRTAVAAAAREVLGGGPLDPTAVRFERGAGGYATAIRERGGERAGSADAFVRALDARVGRGTIRSSRFDLSFASADAVLRGTGLGHGVGLCQAGAARWAARGLDERAILGRYFPGARIGRAPPGRTSSRPADGPPAGD